MTTDMKGPWLIRWILRPSYDSDMGQEPMVSIPSEGRTLGLLFRNLWFRKLDRSQHPGIFRRIELLNDPGGITKDYGMGRKASSNNCLCCHNAISTQHQFAAGAHNCGSLAEPGALADANSASLCNTRLRE